MAQHDYVISNGSGSAVRSDLNNALAAIVSQNSGASEPTTTYAYQPWADTTAGVLKMRNGANNAWITLRELDGTLTIEAGSASTPGLYFAGDANTGIYSPGADQFAIATGGTARLSINANGTLAATSATAATASFTGPANAYVDITDGTGTFRAQLISNVPFVGSFSNHPLVFVTNNTERARVDSSGQLIVAARANGLTNGTIYNVPYTGGQANGASLTLQVDAGGAANALARIIMSTVDLASSNSSFISFATSAGGGGAPSGDLTTEKVRIDGLGNLGVGTPSPATRLDVNGDVTIRSQYDLRFGDSDNSNWVALQAPATVSSNVTFTLPATDGTANQALVTNGSGTLSFATISQSVKAWVNFNGTGTPSIRASFNVSSITDNGTGRFTVNFTTALADADYALAGSASARDGTDDGNNGAVAHRRLSTGTLTSSACGIQTVDTAGNFGDYTITCVAFFR